MSLCRQKTHYILVQVQSCLFRNHHIIYATNPLEPTLHYRMSGSTRSIVLSEDAYAEIEGVWKNFRFRRIEPKDYSNVFAHIRKDFVRDEPTSILFGYSEEFADDFCHIAGKMLPDNMSFLAEDIETGAIAGVRITFHHTKDACLEEGKGFDLKSSAGKNILKLCEDIERMADVEKFLGEDNWAEFFLTSTAPKYRQRGLAGEFYERSIKFLKKSGFRNAVVIVSSPYTRMTTARNGFIELSCLQYKDFIGFDGKLAFSRDQLNDEHFACCKVKAL